jgi:hypothetical protein
MPLSSIHRGVDGVTVSNGGGSVWSSHCRWSQLHDAEPQRVTQLVQTFVPQALSVVPVWQVPASSQHPVQLLDEHGAFAQAESNRMTRMLRTRAD